MKNAKAPRYRKLNPIGYWVSWITVPFNMILGFYLYLHPFAQVPALFNLTYFWSIIFVMLSIVLSSVLLTNNMKGVRAVMIISVAIKAFWAWTLVLISIRVGFGRELYLLDLWFFVAVVQVVIAIFTPPRIDYGLFTK